MLKQQAFHIPRGAAGVSHRKSATLLDSVNYAKVAWQNLSAHTVRNCFIKAEFGLDLKRLSADDDADVNLNELALQLKSLGVTTTEEELQEFNFIDDKKFLRQQYWRRQTFF